MTDFDALVEFLRRRNFNINIRARYRSEGIDYDEAHFYGNGVRGGFGGPGCPSSYLDNRLAADSEACFDKYPKCPLVILLPTSDEERLELFDHLSFLQSNPEHRWSDGFEYGDKLPYNPWRPSLLQSES